MDIIKLLISFIFIKSVLILIYETIGLAASTILELAIRIKRKISKEKHYVVLDR